MSANDRPIIEFPCPDYPIKVIGEAFDGYVEQVLAVVEKHGELSVAPKAPVPSRNGRFVSLTVLIVATGEDQLKALHGALKVLPFVKMVL